MRPSPDSLSSLLRRADPAAGASATDPAAFAAAVHTRIHAADTGPLFALRSFGRSLLPLAAALALLAALAAGSSVAYAQHQRKASELYATAYAKSVDPFLMHAELSAPDARLLP